MNEADKKQFEEILKRIKDNVRGILEAERLEQGHSEGEVTLRLGASPAEGRGLGSGRFGNALSKWMSQHSSG